MQKKILIFLVALVILVPMVIGGVFAYQYSKSQKNPVVQTPIACTQEAKQCPDGSYVSRSGPNCEFAPCPVADNPNPDQKTYTNAQYGFSFQYPVKLASTFASFQSEPTAIITPKGSSDIDSKGCYQLDIQHIESTGIIGGMTFCESSGGDPGAGQLYSSYYYTILHGQNYITLAYVVHTPNGCGPYQGTENYGKCTDFFDHINDLVLDPIRNSVATLKFTK